MSSERVARAIAAAVGGAGGHIAFGVPGGGANLDLVGALDAAGIRFVLTHTENAAGVMAATAAELDGDVSLCLATRGPGAASMTNGVAHALLDRCPVIAVTDSIEAGQRIRIGHQRIDHVGLYSAAAKASVEIGALGADSVAAAAVAAALAPPWGPVHLDTVIDAGPPLALPGAAVGTGPARLDELAGRLKAARRPIVIAGVGARHAEAEVAHLVETLEAPLLTTYKAKGVIAEDSPHAAGMFSGATIEAPAIEASDLVLLVGVDPVELIPARWHYEVPAVYFGPWGVTDPYFPVEVEVIADVAATATALAEVARAGDWPLRGQDLRAETLDKLAWQGADSDLPSPYEVIEETRTQFPGDTILTVDAGAHMLLAMTLWETREPRSVLISSGLATMGFSLPAAVAAAALRPERRVVCLTGDGGLSMCVAELETLARLDLPVTVVVMNDSLLSLIKIKQRPSDHGGQGAVRYRDCDYAQVARGFGLRAERVDSPAGLRQALRSAASGSSPTLIDAVIDPAAYPHVIKAVRG